VSAARPSRRDLFVHAAARSIYRRGAVRSIHRRGAARSIYRLRAAICGWAQRRTAVRARRQGSSGTGSRTWRLSSRRFSTTSSRRRSAPPHLRRHWARPPTSGLGSTRPHLRREWARPLASLRRDRAHPSHICTGTGLTPPTPAPLQRHLRPSAADSRHWANGRSRPSRSRTPRASRSTST
jgi:hypothetical protein